MTAVGSTVRLLIAAAEAARLAPSVHNTQPWTLVVRDESLELRADRRRQLRVLDPRGRQLLISCGCALYNARVAVAAGGAGAVIEHFPDPDDPDLIARLTIDTSLAPGPLGVLAPQIARRRTNRRGFVPEPVPDLLVRELESEARAEHCVLKPIIDAADRATVAGLATRATQLEERDPAYRSEIEAWTTSNPRRADGVQAAAAPNHGPGARNDDVVPIRDLDPRGMGWLPSSSGSDADQCLILLCSRSDDRQGWLYTGQALQAVWLTLTREFFCASPLTQIIEVRETHDALRHRLSLELSPQLLLRIGQAPDAPPSNRRVAAEVIVDRRTTLTGNDAHIRLDDHGVAADVVDRGSCVEINFHVDGGHQPVSARADIVDAVLDLPAVRCHDEMCAAVPLGENEILDGLRHHCTSFTTRAAGATCLIEARLAHLAADESDDN